MNILYSLKMLLLNQNGKKTNKWTRDYIHIHLKKFALPLNINFCLYSIVEKTAVCTTAASDALQ